MAQRFWTKLRVRLLLPRIQRELRTVERQLCDPATSGFRADRLKLRRQALVAQRAELRSSH